MKLELVRENSGNIGLGANGILLRVNIGVLWEGVENRKAICSMSVILLSLIVNDSILFSFTRPSRSLLYILDHLVTSMIYIYIYIYIIFAPLKTC